MWLQNFPDRLVMTQAAVKVLYEIWHNDGSISLGDKNIHNAYLGLFFTYLQPGHLELFFHIMKIPKLIY